MTPIPEVTPPYLPRFVRTVAKQHVLLWLALTAVIALGFQFSSPNQRIVALDVRVGRLEARSDTTRSIEEDIREHQRAEDVWMCLHSTPQEKALLPQLGCR